MINRVQGLSFAMPSFGLGKKEISADHLAIIQKLISLGIIPSYDYDSDLAKLSEALGKMAEAQGQNAQSKEAVAEEGMVNAAASQSSSYMPFGNELDQNALLNKFMFGL